MSQAPFLAGIAKFVPSTTRSQEAVNEMAVEAVWIELVSPLLSLQAGKFTGNFGVSVPRNSVASGESGSF